MLRKRASEVCHTCGRPMPSRIRRKTITLGLAIAVVVALTVATVWLLPIPHSFSFGMVTNGLAGDDSAYSLQTFPAGSTVMVSYTTAGNCTFAVDHCGVVFQIIPDNGTDQSVSIQFSGSGTENFTAYGGAYQFNLWVTGYPTAPATVETASITGSYAIPVL